MHQPSATRRTRPLEALLLLVGIGWLASCAVFEPPLEGEDANTSSDADLETSVDTDATDAPTSDEDCLDPIRINEIDGSTTGMGSDREFIEIVNTSDSARNIGGLHIAKQRGSGPDAGKARTIPDGFILQPGAFLYLVAGVPDAPEGLQETGCIDGAPTPCLQASWDIASTGDTAYLLNRGKTEILCKFEYPDTVVPADAWGRVPDGSPSGVATVPTPGETNVASGR